jgi:hypothetical protein
MAHLFINGDKVQFKLSIAESLGAFARTQEIAISEIDSVEIVPNPWTNQVLKGVRAPGTGIPFVVLLGTMRYRGGKDLCAIYKRRPSAIITVKSGPYKRWIFEIKDMSEVESLNKALLR